MRKSIELCERIMDLVCGQICKCHTGQEPFKSDVSDAINSIGSILETMAAGRHSRG